jgi:hypothetical protein
LTEAFIADTSVNGETAAGVSAVPASEGSARR